MQIFESDDFKKFAAKRELRVHKGKAGLGIMIIEGSHKATGNGIFVSDIQEKSAAFHVSILFSQSLKFNFIFVKSLKLSLKVFKLEFVDKL